MRSLRDRLDLCAINTATLGHRAPIEQVIEDIARYGFGGICPWRRDMEGRDIGAIARRIRAAKLKVSGYCRSTYLPALSTAAFEANIEDNLRAIDQAAELEAACFVMVVGSLPPGSRDITAARAQVTEGTRRFSNTREMSASASRSNLCIRCTPTTVPASTRFPRRWTRGRRRSGGRETARLSAWRWMFIMSGGTRP